MTKSARFAQKMTTTFLTLLLCSLVAGSLAYANNSGEITRVEAEILTVDRKLDFAQSQYGTKVPRLESLQEKIATCTIDMSAVGCPYMRSWERDLEEISVEVPELLAKITGYSEEKVYLQTELIGLQAERPTILPTWGAVAVVLLGIWGGFRLAYLTREEANK